MSKTTKKEITLNSVFKTADCKKTTVDLLKPVYNQLTEIMYSRKIKGDHSVSLRKLINEAIINHYGMDIPKGLIEKE